MTASVATASQIKCGHCSTKDRPAYHETVAQVRLCSQRAQDARAAVEAAEAHLREVQRHRQETEAQEVAPVRRETPQSGLRERIAAIPVGGRGYGYYALDVDGVTKFYRVRQVSQDALRWAGATFVDAQAGDEFYPVRGQARAVVLARIVADPEASGRLYAAELGRCYRCRATLTDETSRALGIGPTCRGSS